MINNKLRTAAEIALLEISRNEDDIICEEHTFSKEFENNMKGIIAESYKEYRRRVIRRARRIIILALSLVIVLVIVVFINPGVRASAQRVIKKFSGINMNYELDSSSGQSLDRYELSELPSKYVTTYESYDSSMGVEVYDDGSNMIILSYESISNQNNTDVYTSKDADEVVCVDEIIYEIYESSVPGDQNTIVWTNIEETVLFTLSSNFGVEDMIDLAKHVAIKKE